MLWGSFFFLLTLPLIVVGWLLLKLSRLAYKTLEYTGFGKVVDTIDSTRVGTWLEKSADRLEKNPVFTTIATAMCAVVAVLAFSLVVMVATFGVWHCLLFLPKVPGLLWAGICFVGWTIIEILSLIGWLVVHTWGLIWSIMTWLPTSGWLWALIGKWLVYILGGVAVSFVTVLLLSKLWAFKATQSVVRWLSMKLNGYSEAREAALKRRLEALKAAEDSPPPLDVPPKRTCKVCEWLGSLFEKIANGIDSLKSQTAKVGGVKAKVMGPLSVAWTFMWAVKYRMCPIVDFVEVTEEMKEEARAEEEAEAKDSEEVESEDLKEEE